MGIWAYQNMDISQFEDVIEAMFYHVFTISGCQYILSIVQINQNKKEQLIMLMVTINLPDL